MTPLVLYALAFAGLAALGGLLLAWTRAPFVARLAVAAVTPWLAFAVWQAARPPIGWPDHTQPPEGAAFVSGVARPPSAADPGEIDLWLQPAGADRPRAYRLPYTPELHRKLAQALAAERATHNGVRLLVHRAAVGSGQGQNVRTHRASLGFVAARLPTKQR
jgi:hypothetical protein